MKLTALLTTFLIATTAIAEEPVELKIFPESAQLKTLRDRQSFVVQAFYANGITRDVTKEAKFALANADVVQGRERNAIPRRRRGVGDDGYLR